jgi:hypothetical protein
LAEEQAQLRRLPAHRQESFRRERVRVDSGSLIRIKHNVYSVNSRLIGERVEVRIHADHLEVWYGQKQVERLPRLRGRKGHCICYRHVIDWLVRKPGAFEHYRYREDLFPTSRFRMAYDALVASTPARASAEYLRILELAARESEVSVENALRQLIDQDQPITLAAVAAWVQQEQAVVAVPTSVFVEPADLSGFDSLFTDMEVWHEPSDGCQSHADWLLAGTASANISG